jgi:hypothetical protein
MGNFVESVGRAMEFGAEKIVPAVQEGGGRASLELRDRNCINSIADNRTAIVWNIRVSSSFESSNCSIFDPLTQSSTLGQRSTAGLVIASAPSSAKIQCRCASFSSLPVFLVFSSWLLASTERWGGSHSAVPPGYTWRRNTQINFEDSVTFGATIGRTRLYRGFRNCGES